MNFFGIGPLELLVILVVALVFVGPERLPRLAADIARTIRELRKYTTAIADEFGEVVKDFEKETEGERTQLSQITEGLTGATKSVTEAIRGARADAEGAPASNVSPPAANHAAATADGAATTAAGAAATADGAATTAAGAAAWREIPEPGTPPTPSEPVPSENGSAPQPAAPPPPPAAGETA